MMRTIVLTVVDRRGPLLTAVLTELIGKKEGVRMANIDVQRVSEKRHLVGTERIVACN